ncbi:MAG: aminotransferase class I/II-fold pyridoxal phosphate-dependent enzyme [Ignavibacteriales bacterium]|nr:aminotransferase class I/II-fold pyridoxal phosphate-dependent enzyme [Ignavibacteriales bacterium]
MKKKPSIATRAIHGKKLHAYKGPLSTPIYQTSTYRFESSDDAIRYSKGDTSVYVYSRYHNPSVEDVEEKLSVMNDADAAALFSSGMAAISTAILSIVKSGDEIISTPSLYGGTYRFFRDVLPLYNIKVKYVAADALSDISKLATRNTKLFYCESPTNPTVGIVDLHKAIVEVQKAGKKSGTKIFTMIDNTFATCLYQSPFTIGFDAIVESATKYIGGHSDILAGVVVGKKEYIKNVRHLAKYLGGCADPFAAFLLSRSLKTFQLRVDKQSENALMLAKHFEKHSKVSRIFYPGLQSHPQHAIAKKQMSGYGAMVCLEVKGGVKSAVKVCDSLKVAVNAMSLGGAETLVSIPVYSSHVNMSGEELAKHGVTPGMIRISIGAEGIDDLIEDFEQALKGI